MSSPNAVVQARLCTWPVCVAARSHQKFSKSELWLEPQPPPAVDTVVSAEKTHYRYNVHFSKKIKGGSTAAHSPHAQRNPAKCAKWSSAATGRPLTRWFWFCWAASAGWGSHMMLNGKKQQTSPAEARKNTEGKKLSFTKSSSLVFEVKFRLGLSWPGRAAKSDWGAKTDNDWRAIQLWPFAVSPASTRVLTRLATQLLTSASYSSQAALRSASLSSSSSLWSSRDSCSWKDTIWSLQVCSSCASTKSWQRTERLEKLSGPKVWEPPWGAYAAHYAF